MNEINLTATRLAGDASLPLLVVAPSLGTSVTALWSAVAERLGERFHVVGIDLPGHGQSPAAVGPLTMADLAQAVLTAVNGLSGAGSFHYAGVSVGGCIGQQLVADTPDRIRRTVILNSAAKIGEAAAWLQRAALVRAEGCATLREASAARWFAPGFAGRDNETANALLDSLCAADATSYAALCEALAGFDLRERLSTISVPMLVIGGRDDVATPPEQQQALATSVRNGRAEILDQVGHLAPAERPAEVAQLLADFLD